MSRTILNDNSEPSENSNRKAKKDAAVKPNLFKEKTETETGKSKFPDWDIVPPNQFINPRIKRQ